jgi:hypothetical protein
MAALAMLWSAVSIGAQQFGTAQEAKAMLERAVTALKANQADALSEFNNKSNKQFHENDLYVFCFNATNGNTLAHPNPVLISTDIRAFKFKGDSIGQRDSMRPKTRASPPWIMSSPNRERPSPSQRNPS